MQTQHPKGHSPPQHNLLQGYAAQFPQGAAQNDEMLGPDGKVKPVWAAFIDHLCKLTPQDLSSRFSKGDQYLRDAGVLYRQYDETLSTEREWPLSHIPVLMSEDEWQRISEGLIERANLLEFVLSDFYGENKLVTSGQLPATLLSQNPAWLRPMMGAANPAGPLLNNLSFEIGRGPDGTWWVISDLVEAPSVTGFAIENRIAMAGVFQHFFATANIHRLAGFFKDFQRALYDLKGNAPGEIALLSPGPMNQNYAEHAYMARYLGLLLVEGEDLIVQDGVAMVRTVAGPKPVSLLWNRLPGSMFDPLELDPASMLGAAGLVQAVRDGTLKTVNMVGSGVLETRALMAFLPKIARAHLGHALSLPNIATWWCGQAAQRDQVLQNRARMMIGNAFSTTPLMADPSTISLIPGAEDTAGDTVQRIADVLRTAGRNLVGQEAVTLSTTPTYEKGKLIPRPMCVRVSLGRVGGKWAVMPGGYARISGGADAKALAMQQGGKVADVWVTSPREVQTTSLLSRGDKRGSRSTKQMVLPSRAADNLFWLGRYVERSQQNMRLFRAYYARISDGAGHEDALPTFIRAQFLGNAAPQAQALAEHFTQPLRMALQAASRISDRFSPDGMMALRALVARMQVLDGRNVAVDDIPVQISGLLRQITGFAGLVHENMYRSDGWRFLSLGVSLERAANMCAVLSACIEANAPAGAFDLALEVGDSVVSHRSHFQMGADAASVIALLALDPQNPRSVRYHVSRAKDHIGNLPRQKPDPTLSQVARLVLLAETRLAAADGSGLTLQALTDLQKEIWAVSSALTAYYLV